MNLFFEEIIEKYPALKEEHTLLDGVCCYGKCRMFFTTRQQEESKDTDEKKYIKEIHIVLYPESCRSLQNISWKVLEDGDGSLKFCSATSTGTTFQLMEIGKKEGRRIKDEVCPIEIFKTFRFIEKITY